MNTENQQYCDDHNITNEPSNINAGKTKCGGCCKLTDEPYTCEFCKMEFCVVEGCIDVNYKGTGMGLCLNCQNEKDQTSRSG